MVVREREPADTRRAAEIDRRAIDDLRRVYRPTDAALRQRSALSSALRGLVAEIDGRVVGVVQYRIEASYLWFLALSVDPAARRCGVASAIVGELERIARNCRCTTVALHTVRETGNVAIFERLGFVVQSERRTDLFVSDSYPELFEVVMTKLVGVESVGSDGVG